MTNTFFYAPKSGKLSRATARLSVRSKIDLMKTKMQIPLSVGVAFISLSAQAQGTFQNLNFEQANPVSAGDHSNPNAVTSTSAFPFWSVYAGSVQLTEVNFNDPDAGTTTVGLVGPTGPFFPAIDGNYSALLQGGGTASAASISQTGLMPAGSQSLLFEAKPDFSDDVLDLSIGTQQIQLITLSSAPTYNLFGANISAWAGQTEPLTFSAPTEAGGNNWVIDDISFSPTAVTPEPSTLALFLMGGAALAARRWRANRS